MSDSLVDAAARTCRQRLLNARADGHWVGELSSSALSTATALFALHLYRQAVLRSREVSSAPPLPPGDGVHRLGALINGGVRWLVAHQNADGGWGDTTRSHSNISTTALCWAALAHANVPETEAKAEAWLARAAGSVSPDPLARAIIARYGKDRTFSVPILTMCALAGRLGEGRDAWRHIPPLPFELAACPHQLFAALRLPVVSYALPALIAMGQVRHHHRPTRNPLTRTLRFAARARTLKVLRAIQPTSGGYLEATPLTSFAVMSLIGAGLGDHPVVAEGVRFLANSVRPDGSWPIDTNLATWVTTLSVNALRGRHLTPDDRRQLIDWLLGQQYRVEHPYTHAPPGAWAWTNLPGGVPDADDTAGALIALHHLAEPGDARILEAATVGVSWLLNLQNRDGGVPTFCRGWGALPFDCSGADLTAHALHAWTAWRGAMSPSVANRIAAATSRALEYVRRVQRPDGSWVPLWFGNQDHAGEENPTYGTSRVLTALAFLAKADRDRVTEMARRAAGWLIAAQRSDGSWNGGAGDGPCSVEETSLAITALSACVRAFNVDANGALQRAADWLSTAVNASLGPSPIGFYFAKLWYFETLYPLIFATGAFELLGARE